MEWTGLNELREKYLSFFESKGHLRLPSFSLIPQGDKSLLLINSGMAPMKKYFTGEVTPPRKRVTTCQKCIRTPDIERVGKTARHGTYFEMLGNFSFGDYFKREAISWAWEFCTQVLKMPPERLYVSIYEQDDEAFDIWTKEVGLDPSRVVRMGKPDNFWEHGAGPCGPCSELYFDRGEQYGCGSPDCFVGCECDRYVEFWNLVFTQFDSDGQGNYTPLQHPNIDTGMGLERLACIMQGVSNLFEVDTVQNIMKHIGQIAGVSYGDNEKTDISLRVITDHIRSTTFMIGDGVMPSNEGRGYVLRRLLRRAARHGRLLGIHEPFLYKVCETVIKENQSAYPELTEKREFIQKVIQVEEEAFGKTIDAGLALLDEMLTSLEGKVLPGKDAFKLYDTFGFPLDLTQDILQEKGLEVEVEEFNRLMAEQRERARAARQNAGMDAWKGSLDLLAGREPNKFVGYDTLKTQATVTAILANDQLVDQVNEGEAALVVLDVCPFYAESGGQVGDTGLLTSDAVTFEVQNTLKSAGDIILLSGEVTQGTLTVGSTVTAAVNETARLATMRNHTAAHLLQAALRKVLGNHVEQAGQMVNDKVVRFDFTHFSALTPEELAKVEQLVNQWILEGIMTDIREMPLDEAKKLGAMALFGEKYGDIVRVVKVGDVSIELCGGTHIDNTAKLGLFRIVSEGSVAAGVRRIEGVTGTNVLDLMDKYKQQMLAAAEAMKASNIDDLARRAAQLMAELKAAQKTLEEYKDAVAASKVAGLLDQARTVNGIQLVTASFAGIDKEEIRTLCDRAKDHIGDQPVVVVLAGISKEGDSVTFACHCSKAAVEKGAHAGKIVAAVAAVCGGKGGGRPDMAMAGGREVDKVDQALKGVDALLQEL